MSLQRAALPLASSPYNLFKAATTATKTTTRPYRFNSPPLCLRCQRQYLTKRRLSTVTEYRPHCLDSAPPPPRNTNIPDTSIAGTSPEISNKMPPRLTGQYGQTSTPSQPDVQSVSETEQEAQIPNPVAPQPSNPSTNDTHAPKPKRTSKLRPRKAAMNLTASATAQIRNLLALPEPKLIRVGVKNKGCSGLTYHLEYVNKAGAFDEAVEQDGVKVLIDSKALFSIIGSEMDWVEDKLNQRFVFKNPNISESHSYQPIKNIDVVLIRNHRGTVRMWRIVHGLAGATMQAAYQHHQRLSGI